MVMSDWHDDPNSEAFAGYFGLEKEPERFETWAYRLTNTLQDFGVVYAVEVAAGIKIGKSGGGRASTPFEQLSRRLTSYRSTSPINVLGLLAAPKADLLQAEAELHHRLRDYHVDRAGRELFVDCPAVRMELLKTMWGDWHTDALKLDANSKLFREMQAAEDGITVCTFNSDFDGFEPSEGWFSPYFSWDTWLKLRPEMELLSYLMRDDLFDDWERYASEMGCLPDTFGESEDDDLATIVMEEMLPTAASAHPRLRERFNRWVSGKSDHGFQPWWDSGLERTGLTMVAVP
jgi:hypothetical protein